MKTACSLEEASGSENLDSYLDTLALAQHMTGDAAKAIETQRRAIELRPDDTELTETLTKYEAAIEEAGDDSSERE